MALSFPLPLFSSSLFLTRPSSSIDSTSGEEWSAWSVCSATCGEGWQSRTRFCVSSSYSTQCSGPLQEQRTCNPAVCPGKFPFPVRRPNPLRLPSPLLDASPLLVAFPIFYLGYYSPSMWIFFGLKLQKKAVNKKTLDQNIGSWKKMSMDLTIIILVSLHVNHTLASLFAVAGAWDEWSPWSLCSSTCGRGYRSRTRTCTPPQFGGDPCDGPEKQTKFCNIAVCPGETHNASVFCQM